MEWATQSWHQPILKKEETLLCDITNLLQILL